MTAGNLFADVPPSLPAELVETLAQAGGVRVERIVSTGHATPAGEWYDGDAAEWVALLCGAAALRFEDEPAPRVLAAGDHVLIAAHRRHRVEWTDAGGPTVWLGVHFPPEPRAARPR